MTDYSVVIPAHNEAASLPALLEEVRSVMANTSWELIVVDDGSTDATEGTLRLQKCSGQTAALDAGFRAARGEWIITLDADGQNDPHDIPRLLARAQEGYDLVVGIRANRRDTPVRRLISRAANGVRRWLLDDGSSDTGCSLKVLRRSCLDHIVLYKGMHRFLPALFRIHGYRTAEVPVNHRPRKAGRSHYPIWSRGPALIADLLAVRWMKQRALRYEIVS